MRKVSAKRFVSVWRAIWARGGKLADVARRLNLTPRQATTRAHWLRQQGISLGRFSAAGPRIDYDELR